MVKKTVQKRNGSGATSCGQTATRSTETMEHWIGVDLDGTLAEYHGWQGIEHIGAPIKPMVKRINNYLANGLKVKILTARAGTPEAIPYVKAWLRKHVSIQEIEVTDKKDFMMSTLFDDRCLQIELNTGKSVVTELKKLINNAEGLFGEVVKERMSQEAKWGQQNHDGPLYLTILTEEVGEVAKAILDHRYKNDDPIEIRKELIQVAAVAIAMVENYDRGNCR